MRNSGAGEVMSIDGKIATCLSVEYEHDHCDTMSG